MKSKVYSHKDLNRLRGIWYRLFPSIPTDMIDFRVRLVGEGCPVEYLHSELNHLSKVPDLENYDIVISPDFDFDKYFEEKVMIENKLFE